MKRLESGYRGGGSGRNQPEGSTWAKAERRRCKGQCTLLFALESQVLFGGPAGFLFFSSFGGSLLHNVLLVSAIHQCESVVHPAYTLCWFSRVRLFATLWVVAHQAPLSMGFSRPEYWSGLPRALPEWNLSLVSPALAGRFFSTSAIWESKYSRPPTSWVSLPPHPQPSLPGRHRAPGWPPYVI